MTSVSNILSRARGEIGTKENPLDSNRVKYCDWYYGRAGASAPWCAIFVSWVFYHEGLPLPFTTSKGFAAVRVGVASFQAKKQWHTSNPRPGDVVFFTYSHVGIVESVNSDGSIVSIEGNSSHRVQRVHHPQSQIRGYGRPNYSGGSVADDWFWGLSRDNLKNAVREVLNEGTAQGQKTWGDTNQTILGTSQIIINFLRSDLITAKLPINSGELKTLLEERAQLINPSNH